MNIGYVAIHKETGDFFVGKTTQVAYTKMGYLKSAIKYHGKKIEDYELKAITSGGKFLNI